MKLGYDNISINGGVQVKRSEPLRPLHFFIYYLVGVQMGRWQSGNAADC